MFLRILLSEKILYYADLNQVIESWRGVFTNVGSETIIDRVREKWTARIPKPRQRGQIQVTALARTYDDELRN